MSRFVYSLYPQASHFFCALGENPAFVMIAILVCGSVAYAAWRHKESS